MVRHFTFLVITACSLLGSTRDVGGQSIVPTITSDTPAYCDLLMNRISGLSHGASLPREAVMLSVEGEKMCVHGQIRGGIMRLRRALAIMRKPGE